MPRASQKARMEIRAAYGFRPARPGESQAFEWRDDNHTRYNKRYPDSVAVLCVQVGEDFESNRWASLRLEELTEDKNGRVSSRVISVSLDGESRAALIAFLQSDGKAPA